MFRVLYRTAVSSLSRVLRGSGEHQQKTSTSLNRYPEIFSAARVYFSTHNSGNLRILSFGCSRGDECFSLRTYFPNAQIIGVDVDRVALWTARRRNNDSRVRFALSNEKNIARASPLDAVFCMSVLCRWPETKDLEDISAVYPFERFQQSVVCLDRYLKPGGLLVIANSNYRFCDTNIYNRYTPVSIPYIVSTGFVKLFDVNGQALKTSAYTDVIFAKRPMNL